MTTPKARMAVLMTAGFVGFALVGVGASAATASPNTTLVTATNSAGQSYGSAATAQSIAQEPDLILAKATNGQTGYVKKADLEPSSLRTPQQAVAYSKLNEAGRNIQVYASDGKTRVGKFKIGGNTSSSSQLSAGTPQLNGSLGNADSSWGYFGPIGGHSYMNQSEIISSYSGAAEAQTCTQNQVLTNVPSGYIGSDGRLFNGSGALMTETGYVFNSGSAYAQYATAMYRVHGTYYSYGVSAAFNGSGYSYYYAFRSPNQNW